MTDEQKNQIRQTLADEYQGYTPTIFKLKTSGADKETIAKTLHEIETVTIGVVGNIEHCRQVADKIINLK